MKKKIINVCLLVVLCLVLSVSSASAYELCSKKMGTKTVVGYFNGIQNTYADASKSLWYIHDSALGDSSGGENLAYQVFYNTTKGFFSDMLELYAMRAEEHNMSVAGFWSSNAVNNLKDWERSNAFLQERAKAEKGYYEKTLTNPTTLSDLAEHRLYVEKFLLEGKKLLLVAHSQGNLFVNAAYDVATSFYTRLYKGNPADSIKVVHVAPASRTLRGPYILNDQDMAIKFLPGSTPSINVYLFRNSFMGLLSCGFPDRSFHKFVDTYLNKHLLDGCSRYRGTLPFDRFMTLANNALYSMRSPMRAVTEGFFGVTMKWDSPGDMDLIVEEGSGKVVSYSNKEGESGRLDRDIINGPGEEHYYAKCDSVDVVGTYKIYVKSHSLKSGRGPKNVRVLVSSFDGRFNYVSPVLDASIETVGYDRVHVADIRVRRNPRRHTYTISRIWPN